jgi:hypothetical protein
MGADKGEAGFDSGGLKTNRHKPWAYRPGSRANTAYGMPAKPTASPRPCSTCCRSFLGNEVLILALLLVAKSSSDSPSKAKANWMILVLAVATLAACDKPKGETEAKADDLGARSAAANRQSQAAAKAATKASPATTGGGDTKAATAPARDTP